MKNPIDSIFNFRPKCTRNADVIFASCNSFCFEELPWQASLYLINSISVDSLNCRNKTLGFRLFWSES